jgi:cytidyltransferase-like protein
MARALYPGTFDPIHNGHIDIARACGGRVFDEVVVAIYDAPPKKLLFTTEERLTLASTGNSGEPVPNISLIVTYTGLTIRVRAGASGVDVPSCAGCGTWPTSSTSSRSAGPTATWRPAILSCAASVLQQRVRLPERYRILKEVASLGGDCEALGAQAVCLMRSAPGSTARCPPDRPNSTSNMRINSFTGTRFCRQAPCSTQNRKDAQLFLGAFASTKKLANYIAAASHSATNVVEDGTSKNPNLRALRSRFRNWLACSLASYASAPAS